MFERWTRSAKEVLKRADTIARKFGVTYIDTTHLLLAFLEVTKDMEVWKLFWEEFNPDSDRIRILTEKETRIEATPTPKDAFLDLTRRYEEIIEGVTTTTTCVTLKDLLLKILETDCAASKILAHYKINKGSAEIILQKFN